MVMMMGGGGGGGGGGKINVKITLEQATKAQRGSRCTALLFLQPRH